MVQHWSCLKARTMLGVWRLFTTCVSFRNPISLRSAATAVASSLSASGGGSQFFGPPQSPVRYARPTESVKNSKRAALEEEREAQRIQEVCWLGAFPFMNFVSPPNGRLTHAYVHTCCVYGWTRVWKTFSFRGGGSVQSLHTVKSVPKAPYDPALVMEFRHQEVQKKRERRKLLQQQQTTPGGPSPDIHRARRRIEEHQERIAKLQSEFSGNTLDSTGSSSCYLRMCMSLH